MCAPQLGSLTCRAARSSGNAKFIIQRRLPPNDPANPYDEGNGVPLRRPRLNLGGSEGWNRSRLDDYQARRHCQNLPRIPLYGSSGRKYHVFFQKPKPHGSPQVCNVSVCFTPSSQCIGQFRLVSSLWIMNQ